MIVYNETYVVDEAIHQQWLNWMQAEQLPAIMKTGWFNSFSILTVLDSPNEGMTYCIQFVTDSLESYNYFRNKHLQWFHQLLNQRFENKFVVFNSLMQRIDQP